mgnify:FL=1
MQLSGIGQYLEIYRKKLLSATDQKQLIIEAIYITTGIRVSEKDVTIDHATVTIKTDSVTKNHFFLYKKKILEEIKRTSTTIVVEVR